MSNRVRFGRQLVDVISAEPGAMAERFTNVMATPRVVPEGRGVRVLRQVTPWRQDGACRSSIITVAADGDEVTSANDEEKRFLTLKVGKGVREGIFLLDCPELRKFSLDFKPGEDGELVLPVPGIFSGSRIHEASCLILAVAFRGTEWTDRSGRLHKSPCGDRVVHAIRQQLPQSSYFVKQ